MRRYAVVVAACACSVAPAPISIARGDAPIVLVTDDHPIRAAAELWNTQAGCPLFVLRHDRDGGVGDVVVVDEEHSDAPGYGHNRGTVKCERPGRCEMWISPNHDEAERAWTAVHELGHVLGLGHAAYGPMAPGTMRADPLFDDAVLVRVNDASVEAVRRAWCH